MKCILFYIIITLTLVGILYSQPIVRTYNGIVNDNAVRIRAEPSIDSAIVGRLDQGMAVTVYGRTQERMFLDGYNSFWLKNNNFIY